MTLKRRMYSQLAVVFLPLLTMIVFTLSTQQRPEDVARAVHAYNLTLDASGRYRSFMSGVADAVDFGTIGDRTIEALRDARARMADLSRAAPRGQRAARLAR